jgi:dTDP-4-dehydrorhamnose 3,5-epimerase
MGSRFDIHDTPIQGLKVLHRKPLGDNRGYLERMYCQEELRELGDGMSIVQINHTLTTKTGVVRGMHFQHPPHSEVKFVSCLRGEVFDVAVDLRLGSPTFLKWHVEILSPENHKTLLIPQGFAHGFQTLSDNCELLYFHTAMYVQDAEGGLNATDPHLAIQWGLPISERSDRDMAHPLITDQFTGLTL